MVAICPVQSLAQKAPSVEIDKFTGEKRIETDYVTIATNFFTIVSLKLRTVDTTVFLTLAGSWAVGMVGPQDKAMFLFEDKSTMAVYPTSIQSYDIGVGQYSSNSYRHQYALSQADLQILSTKKPISLRREFNSNYADIDIKEKNAKKIQNLARLVLLEMQKK